MIGSYLCSGIPWREISGFRNILVHDYLGDIDPITVASVIHNHLHPLQVCIQAMLNSTEKKQNVDFGSPHPFPIVVLISGRGSNLQAIIDATHRDLPVEIRAVISNRADAFGLERARRAGIETVVLEHRSFPSRVAFDQALESAIEQFEPHLVVLAGFMRILTPAFVAHFAGRLINIHPALLPQLPGLDTHERAIAEGFEEHGATVHFVTEEVDAGPVILQARVPVLLDDTPETLAARVLVEEHRIFPQAIRWFMDNEHPAP